MTKIKLLAAALLVAFVLGCQTQPKYEDVPDQPAVMQSAGFNEEHYIWESFLFPTNRTSGRQ